MITQSDRAQALVMRRHGHKPVANIKKKEVIKIESKDLQRVYALLSAEITKAQRKIDGIDRTIKYCNRLDTEYWRDKRVEAVAYLNGICKARDIVWKELHR